MRKFCFIVLLATFAPFAPSHAAPQMLGLFATGPAATPLRCDDGVCSAEFSAFCLQQNRDAPLDGTAYRPVDSTQLRLVLRDRAGDRRAVPAEELTIRSARNYTAVRIAMPEETVRRLGGVAAALHVAARTTLAPVPVANDPTPLTEAEMALAAGRHRAIGERHVEQGGKLSQAAKAAMKMINVLPADAAALPPDDQARSAWAALGPNALGEKGRRFLEQRVEVCTTLAWSAWFKGGVATCLKSFHDSFVSTLNGDYWAAVGAGL